MFGFRNRKKYNGAVDTKLNDDYQIATRDNDKFPGILKYLEMIDASWNNNANEDECAMQIGTLYLCGLFRNSLWDETRIVAANMDRIGLQGVRTGRIRKEIWEKCVALVEQTQREVSKPRA